MAKNYMWRKTSDPMKSCHPPKRWIRAPEARARGMSRGFCEAPQAPPNAPLPAAPPGAWQKTRDTKARCTPPKRWNTAEMARARGMSRGFCEAPARQATPSPPARPATPSPPARPATPSPPARPATPSPRHQRLQRFKSQARQVVPALRRNLPPQMVENVMRFMKPGMLNRLTGNAGHAALDALARSSMRNVRPANELGDLSPALRAAYFRHCKPGRTVLFKDVVSIIDSVEEPALTDALVGLSRCNIIFYGFSWERENKTQMVKTLRRLAAIGNVSAIIYAANINLSLKDVLAKNKQKVALPQIWPYLLTWRRPLPYFGHSSADMTLVPPEAVAFYRDPTTYQRTPFVPIAKCNYTNNDYTTCCGWLIECMLHFSKQIRLKDVLLAIYLFNWTAKKFSPFITTRYRQLVICSSVWIAGYLTNINSDMSTPFRYKDLSYLTNNSYTSNEIRLCVNAVLASSPPMFTDMPTAGIPHNANCVYVATPEYFLQGSAIFAAPLPHPNHALTLAMNAFNELNAAQRAHFFS
jgi:hypothetical protein